jgi:thiol-disulfide isomerase/thioredoxin
MNIKVLSIISYLIFSGISITQAPPDPASKIINEAFIVAARENKNVMVVFHASWCGWCKKFDASINDIVCKDFFEKNFVIRHLTILESKDKKDLENPGAIDLFNNNCGKGGGIPYFLIFDKTGKILADSKIKPANAGPEAKTVNMGCPSSDEEVMAFIQILRKTTKITNAQVTAISGRFKKNRN